MLSRIKALLYVSVRMAPATTRNATAYWFYMRQNRLVGVAYSKPIKLLGGEEFVYLRRYTKTLLPTSVVPDVNRVL